MSIPRSRSRFVSNVIGSVQQTQNGSPLGAPVSYGMNVVFQSIDDILTANFSTLKAQGEIINNPCLFLETKTSSVGGWVYDISNGGTNYVLSGDGSATHYYETVVPRPGIPSWTAYDKTALIARAQLLAYSRVDSTPYSFAEDVFELRETIRFLRNPLESLRNVSNAFRKAWQKRARDLSRSSHQRELVAKKLGWDWRRFLFDPRDLAIAEVWVTYRFAFSPLLRSVTSIIDAYDKPVVRSKRRTSRSSVSARNATSDVQVLNAYENRSYSLAASIEIKAGILYEVTNPVVDFQFKYGLRLKDIPVTLWAVLPYSFMIDRVVDISSSIKGITNFLDPEVKILAGWVTEKESTSQEAKLIHTLPPGWTGTKTFDTVVSEQFRYQRTPWSPSFSDLYPGINLGGLVSDITRSVDLLALIHLNLGGSIARTRTRK